MLKQISKRRLAEMTDRMMGMHYFMQFGASGVGICTSAFVMSKVISCLKKKTIT